MAWLLVILAISRGATVERAAAADSPGLYIGAAIGRADVRADEVAFPATPQGADAVPLGFDEHDTGWKLLVGLRPIPLIGAELEYVDFGHPSSFTPFGSLLRMPVDAHPNAAVLSGLIYAPLSSPLFDLYGKLGLARLQETVHATVVCTAPPEVACPPTRPFPAFALSETDTRFAYGAGAQVRFSAFAVRLEYERVSASGGDPDLLSLGLTWRF
jgi:hypothetical protein